MTSIVWTNQAVDIIVAILRERKVVNTYELFQMCRDQNIDPDDYEAAITLLSRINVIGYNPMREALPGGTTPCYVIYDLPAASTER